MNKEITIPNMVIHIFGGITVLMGLLLILWGSAGVAGQQWLAITEGVLCLIMMVLSVLSIMSYRRTHNTNQLIATYIYASAIVLELVIWGIILFDKSFVF
jgi:uncharacterized membrane protein SirB2